MELFELALIMSLFTTGQNQISRGIESNNYLLPIILLALLEKNHHKCKNDHCEDKCIEHECHYYNNYYHDGVEYYKNYCHDDFFNHCDDRLRNHNNCRYDQKRHRHDENNCGCLDNQF